ncbi:MAG: phage integrase SAM-like domain-containing protein, partial [Bacteroidales bacterium]|nr:phage integrase SAM-like domain-containing protein [Bacteroidales bacterium]
MATIRFRLSSKADKSTGQCEVLVRFFHGRFDQYAKTNIFVQPHFWNPTGERVTIPRVRVMSPEAKQLTTELTDINTRLQKVKQHIQESFIEAGAGKVQLPGSWLADLMHEYNFPKVEVSRGILDVMEEYNESRTTSGSNQSHARVCWRAFHRFLLFKDYNLNMALDDLTAEVMAEFLEYLRDEHTFYEVTTDESGKRKITYINGDFQKAFQVVPESRLPKERGENAICEFVKHFRSFYLWAIDQGLTTNNPFRHFSAPQPLYGTPYYITIEERNKLLNCDLSDNPRLAVQRDIFVFQCVIGCRVSD